MNNENQSTENSDLSEEQIITVYINNIESKPFWVSLFDKFAGDGIKFHILPIKARKKLHDYEIPQDLIDQANYNLLFALDGSYLIRRFSSIGRRYSLEREHYDVETLEKKLAKIIAEFKEKYNKTKSQDKSLPTVEALQVYFEEFTDTLNILAKQERHYQCSYSNTEDKTILHFKFLPCESVSNGVMVEEADLQVSLASLEDTLSRKLNDKTIIIGRNMHFYIIGKPQNEVWQFENAQEDSKALLGIMLQNLSNRRKKNE